MHLLPFGGLGEGSGQLSCGGHGGWQGSWGDAGRCGSQVCPDHGHTTCPCKRGPSPDVLKDLDTTWLGGVGWGEQLIVPLCFYHVFILLLWWTRQLLQRTTIAWVWQESNTECFLQQLQAALAADYHSQANQGASDPSRSSKSLCGPGSSFGSLCSVLASLVSCPDTLGRAPGTGNSACDHYGARALLASSCTEAGRQESSFPMV